jgi:Golgi phosphoprotein 3 (GPP34)
MLLAEDLLLLLTDDASGKLRSPAGETDIALGGANLVELTLMGQADLSSDGDPGKPGRIIVRDPAPPGDEVLAGALQTLIDHQGDKPQAVITPLGKNLRTVLYQRLTDSGVLRAEHGRILGIFPTRTWPAKDGQHEAGVRQLITQVLVPGAAPDQRIAALIALLHALRCEDKVVDPQQNGISKKELRARAEQIAEGDWASEAVRKAIEQMMAAVIAATTAATAAAAT